MPPARPPAPPTPPPPPARRLRRRRSPAVRRGMPSRGPAPSGWPEAAARARRPWRPRSAPYGGTAETAPSRAGWRAAPGGSGGGGRIGASLPKAPVAASCQTRLRPRRSGDARRPPHAWEQPAGLAHVVAVLLAEDLAHHSLLPRRA